MRYKSQLNDYLQFAGIFVVVFAAWFWTYCAVMEAVWSILFCFVCAFCRASIVACRLRKRWRAPVWR